MQLTTLFYDSSKNPGAFRLFAKLRQVAENAAHNRALRYVLGENSWHVLHTANRPAASAKLRPVVMVVSGHLVLFNTFTSRHASQNFPFISVKNIL